MKFIFGTMGVHLHNLKILLKNDVKIKNLWIGINDFIIWKDPKDHDNSFKRRPYPDGFLNSLMTYNFYLFEKIGTNQIQALKGDKRLRPSEVHTNPNNNNMPYAYRREANIAKDPQANIEKINKAKPTLLGYTDTTYRIDEAIEEIKEIQKLCQEHGITLTLFIYPSFHKTYLYYNQDKIDEFKTKLASVTEFHDFYYLRDWSFNKLLWHDTSHFTVGVGNQVLKAIQENHFLVTKDTIEEQIQKTREALRHFFQTPHEEIYLFNINLGLGSLNKVFDLKENKDGFIMNDHMKFSYEKEFISIDVRGNDPIMILKQAKVKSKNAVLSFKMESQGDTFMTLFYKKKSTSEYNGKETFRIPLHKGMNTFNILIPQAYINNELRVDLTERRGKYKLEELSVHEIK